MTSKRAYIKQIYLPLTFLLCFLIIPYSTYTIVSTTTIEINAPGTYTLPDNYFFNPNSSIPAIHIKANNVVLNLNQKNLVLVNTIPDVAGIIIDPDLAGIQILNGTIARFTSTGIMCNEGASSLRLQDLNFAQCSQAAVDLAGTSIKPITNSALERLTITACGTAATATSLVSGSFLESVPLSSIRIIRCGNNLANISAFKLLNALKCQMLQCTIADSVGGSFVGFDLDACNSFITLDPQVVNNSSQAADGHFIGYRLANGSSSNIVRGFFVLNNESTQGDLIGVDVDGSEGNLLHLANIVKNSGNSFAGCRFSGTGTPSNNILNLISESFILQNCATNGDCSGVFVSRADRSGLRRIAIGYNTAESGVAAGIYFESTTGGNNWIVRECEVVNNLGIDDDNSYGILIETGTQNIFVQNISFQNGANSENQLNGVSNNSIGITDPSNINTIIPPWTNVGVS